MISYDSGNTRPLKCLRRKPDLPLRQMCIHLEWCLRDSPNDTYRDRYCALQTILVRSPNCSLGLCLISLIGSYYWINPICQRTGICRYENRKPDTSCPPRMRKLISCGHCSQAAGHTVLKTDQLPSKCGIRWVYAFRLASHLTSEGLRELRPDQASCYNIYIYVSNQLMSAFDRSFVFNYPQ